MSEPDAPAPRANARLLGQQAAEAVLLNAYRSGRLPHAWLLTGPRGVGKATLAYRFARFLFAGGGEAAEEGLFGAPPPPSDLAVAADRAGLPARRRPAGHPDLRVAGARRQRAHRQAAQRDRRSTRCARRSHFLRLTAAEGGWRVIVVDSADEMNRNAANALLKILEEPAPNSLMLLVSHAPGALLATIRSRCCHLALPPLESAVVTGLLDDYAPGLEAAEKVALLQLSEGSIGRALALLEAGGLDLYRALLALLSGLPRLDIAKAQAFAEGLARGSDGRAFATAMELLGWWLARLVREAAAGQLPPAIVPEETGLAERLLARRPLAEWLALWEKLTRLVARTDRVNLDRKQVAMVAFLEFEALTAA